MFGGGGPSERTPALPRTGRTQAPAGSLFKSFFQAGFECSSHRRGDGRRLDLINSTRHDRLAAEDYGAVAELGLRTVRDGLRWHRIEIAPGRYDWSSFLPMLRAAQDAGLQVVWDLCHYGYPDDLDIWKPAFVERFARFSAAATRLILDETGEAPFFCPVNEISYWSWAGGATDQFNPFGRNRGDELKRQLVRATIAAIEAAWEVDARVRVCHCDPLINVTAAPNRPRDRAAAAGYHLAQYQAYDMIAGRMAPELGGKPAYLDIIGANYYPENQFHHGGGTIPFGHHGYRPLHELLGELYDRYGRPLFIAEAGAEGSARAAWLYYVAGEVQAAMAAGVPVEGVCLYPVLDYPGWENGRTCKVGLLSRPEPGAARRELHAPLAQELRRQQALLPYGLSERRIDALDLAS